MHYLGTKTGGLFLQYDGHLILFQFGCGNRWHYIFNFPYMKGKISKFVVILEVVT